MVEAAKLALGFDIDDVCLRFSMIYTGAILDVLDEMGCRHQVLPHSIQALDPALGLTGWMLTESTADFEVRILKT